MKVLLFLLLLTGLTNARIIGSNDNTVDIDIDDQKVANDSEKEDAYESDGYNRFVEKLLETFTVSSHAYSHDINKILVALTSSIVSNSAYPPVVDNLDDAFIHQCGVAQYNQRAKEIEEISRSRDQCLGHVQTTLIKDFRQKKDWEHSLRTEVTAQLLCSIVPEVASCFDDSIEFLLSCTNHAEYGMPVYKAFKNILMEQYCTDEKASDLIAEVPSTCISHGLDYFLKFIGPAFIKKLPVIDPIEYPCAISQYLRQVSSVILPMQCQATELVKLISQYSNLLNRGLQCSHSFDR